MDLSREQLINMLRHAGLTDIANAAEAELPSQADAKALSRFCNAHGLSLSMLTDRMGASP